MLAPIQRCSPRLINRFDWERTAYPHGPNKDDLRFLWMVGLPPKNRHRELHPTRRVKNYSGQKRWREYLRNTETDVNRLDRTDWIMQKLLSSYSNYDGKFVANLLNF
jgi:hypothetical protein